MKGFWHIIFGIDDEGFIPWKDDNGGRVTLAWNDPRPRSPHAQLPTRRYRRDVENGALLAHIFTAKSYRFILELRQMGFHVIPSNIRWGGNWLRVFAHAGFGQIKAAQEPNPNAAGLYLFDSFFQWLAPKASVRDAGLHRLMKCDLLIGFDKHRAYLAALPQ